MLKSNFPSPCKDCPSRKVGCHSECTAYNQVKIEYQIWKESCEKARWLDRMARKPYRTKNFKNNFEIAHI